MEEVQIRELISQTNVRLQVEKYNIFSLFSQKQVLLTPREEVFIPSNIDLKHIPDYVLCEIKEIQAVVMRGKLIVRPYTVTQPGIVQLALTNKNADSSYVIRKDELLAVLTFQNIGKNYPLDNST